MERNRFSFLKGILPLCAAALLSGCDRVALLAPKGPVGASERSLILIAFGLMLIVVIPVFIMVVWFPLKYRASNTRAEYAPKWSRSRAIELVIWLVPAAIVTALGILTWTMTHSLDPYKPISSNAEPIRIEAVSLDWKWLFIYPDQRIATVNELVFPANVPLNFRLTSDTVMTSFFIPRLGSQIYAMAGMQTRLHLLADEPGVYAGQNQQYSGEGYSDMKFQAIATSPEEFEAWVKKARQSNDSLDLARYEDLRKPTIDAPVSYFSSVKAGLFDHIIGSYMSPAEMPPGAMGGKSGRTPAKTPASEGS